MKTGNFEKSKNRKCYFVLQFFIFRFLKKIDFQKFKINFLQDEKNRPDWWDRDSEKYSIHLETCLHLSNHCIRYWWCCGSSHNYS